jgi:membrane-associated phospholipid phosphatase
MRQRFGKLFCLGILTLALPVGAAEQDAATAPTGWLATLQADGRAFPCRLEADAEATFVNGGNLVALLGAGAASVTLSTSGVDDHVADYFARHDTFGRFTGESLFVVGMPAVHFAGTALWYVLAAECQDDPGRQRALTMFSALTITGAVTGGIKLAVRNDQPDGGPWSWPSCHTASSVAVASVLHEFYGWKVGLPAYAGAGLVAWRMMDEGDHWASDVLFGAVLGWVVGHTVAGRDGNAEIAGFEVLPYYGNDQTPAAGISLARRF